MAISTRTQSAIDVRLNELKVVIPDLEAAMGLYVPAIKVGSVITTSGQLPKSGGKIEYKGRLGKEIDIETGKRAARLALINALAAVKHTLGGTWAPLKRALYLRIAVTSMLGFNDQAAVADGASDLLLKIMGPEQGAHARFTWGVVELPGAACLELELSVETRA